MIPDLMALPTTIARCDHVRRVFDVRGEQVVALDGIDVQVEPARLLAIAGPSGSGKSTLLALLGCLDRPTTGTVHLGPREVSGLGRRARRRLRRDTVAMVLPQPSDNLLVHRSGVDNLRMAMRHRKVHGPHDPAIRAVVDDIDIGDYIERTAGTMSGGEQQRLALACALIGGTTLVLADEPTGALDDANAAQVIGALRRAVTNGATIVVATHDPAVIDAADDVVRLAHGRRVQ